MAYRVPAQAYFVVSAVFHYLGPALAVLLFAAVEPLGVAWLRIVSAAAVFALWRRPWRTVDWREAVPLGLTLAAMNSVFYLAIDRLPLATVGAIEFLGPIVLAVVGLRGRRNAAALALAIAGVALLTQVRLTGEPIGFALAFANCALFVAYVVLSKRIAGGNGIDVLAMSMVIAAIAVSPVGLGEAIPALRDGGLLVAGIGVGVCSSVIPYVCDQLALRRLQRSTFAVMLSLLPATAAVIGFAVLAQRPAPAELAGIALVVAAVGVHKERESDDRSGDDELRRPRLAGLASERG